jgi:GWxTD domain-containing protein
VMVSSRCFGTFFPVLLFFSGNLSASSHVAQPSSPYPVDPQADTKLAPVENGDDPLQRPRSAKARSAMKKELRAYDDWLNKVAPYIITEEERNAFKKLTNNTERDAFIEHFWDVRNITPDSSVNEFKEEHYRRIAYANDHFAAGIPGWKTDRGRIYIMHGPPDSIEPHPMGGPYQRPAQEGGGETQTYPFEIWTYRNLDGIGQQIELEFVDTCGCGEYHLTLDPGEKDALSKIPGAGPTLLESLGMANKADRLRGGLDTSGASLFDAGRQAKQFDRLELLAKVNAPPPVRYRTLKEDVHSLIRFTPLPFNSRVDFVKADGGMVVVPVTIQVANRELTYIAKDGVQHAAVSISGQLTNLTGKVISSFDDPLGLDVPTEHLNEFADAMSVHQAVVTVRPGRYLLDLVVKDVNGTKVGTLTQTINVPDFAGEERLAASSLILADLMEPLGARDPGTGRFVLGASRVRPRVARTGEPPVFRRNQKVNLWMQIYNLALDDNTRQSSTSVEYHVINAANRQIVADFSDRPDRVVGAGRQITLEKTVLPEKLNLDPGLYEVTVEVKDLLSQQTLVSAAKFAIKYCPASWIESAE